MSVALLRPQPLPPERVQPGVGLLVVALHLGLVWVASLYWPLQSMLMSAVQNSASSITVQIFPKSMDRPVSAGNDNTALSANPQAISNAGRQRFGRAEATLELPAAQAETSTPLASTVQTAQATVVPALPLLPPPAPNLAATPLLTAALKPSAVPTPPALDAQAKPAKPAEPAEPVPQTAATPERVPAPVAAPAINPSSPLTSSVSSANPVSSPGTASASGAALVSGSGPAAPSTGSAVTPVSPAPSVGPPFNLSLPPRYIYRPPIAVPRRSLSEMANDQLRRKPRDPFAEGIDGAGNIDCLKDTPEGPAQGLLAIGPLLKRAIEDKCRK